MVSSSPVLFAGVVSELTSSSVARYDLWTERVNTRGGAGEAGEGKGEKEEKEEKGGEGEKEKGKASKLGRKLAKRAVELAAEASLETDSSEGGMAALLGTLGGNILGVKHT